MKKACWYCIALLPLIPLFSLAQQQTGSDAGNSSTADKIINFPTRLFSRIEGKTASLNQQLTKQTEKYLKKMARQEAKMQKKLSRVDSAAAKRLFANSAAQYAALEQKIMADTGRRKANALNGEYLPYIDSLNGTLGFLRQNPQLVGSANPNTSLSSLQPTALQSSLQLAALQSAAAEFQQLQSKMGDAGEAQAFIQQRKQLIGDYISQHANLQTLLGPEYTGIKQDLYYYSDRLRQYKEMLGDPDKLEQKALSLLDQLPAFQSFMKNTGQLAGMFGVPANYGTASALNGLQTREQVAQIIQSQISVGGAAGVAALSSNLESATKQLDQFKQKLSQLGTGSGSMDMPDFKPNQQKTKTFWKRLEYGTNLQTTRTNYYWPTTTTIALSLGYKLNNQATVGVGMGYEIGWGAGINHIALSSQGASMRSYLDFKIKGTWSATGGLEYNYTTPINKLQQLQSLSDWTQSGLVGVSKTVSVKNRFFKQTKLQLLWDFLSYQQVPQTQPILFRVGYNF